MPDYKAMYYHLAGRIAGAIEALEAITETLKQAQQPTEDVFINNDEDGLNNDSKENT